MNVTNLCFQHHKRAPHFFRGLTFELEKGRLHALHGKNGIGKSVLLHILTQNIEKEAVMTGTISERHIAFMNQRFDQMLVAPFNALQNIQFAHLKKYPSPFSRLKNSPLETLSPLLSLLEKFHIDPTVPLSKLSGGQRQIVALFMQLQRKAKVLLLDEPTAALDEENAQLVFEFLSTLKDVTILAVCHDLELISKYTTGSHLQMEINTENLRIIHMNLPL